MPKPTCVQCGANDSLLWRNQENGQICNECYLANTASKEAESRSECEGREDEDARRAEGEATPARATGKGTRKSTRATRYKPKPTAAAGAPGARVPSAPGARAPAPRGRGRRAVFKRPPLRAPTATATLVTSDYIFYKGWYMQVGDIVSMVDLDGGTYYAQVRGFLTDQYCEKSAVVTWLLPTKASPPPEECFDPATYIIGPEEQLPRKLEYMQFVMHAPGDYYRSSRPPGARTEPAHHAGYIWTSLDARDRT